MRKLSILKAIVDYLWVLSMVVFPLIVIFSIVMVFDSDIIDIPIKTSGKEFILDTIWNKIAFLILTISFGLLLFALYKFRKLLQLFKDKKIFEVETALLFNEIGKLIIYYSFIDLFVEFLLKLSKNEIIINLGYGSFLSFLSLGLFFVVLGEVFKIGQRIKEQNELTI